MLRKLRKINFLRYCGCEKWCSCFENNDLMSSQKVKRKTIRPANTTSTYILKTVGQMNKYNTNICILYTVYPVYPYIESHKYAHIKLIYYFS